MQKFRSLGWDGSLTHDASPFRIVDPGFNAILIRSELDIADLADRLGLPEIAARNRDWAEAGLAALDTLWDDGAGQYQPFDRAAGRRLDSPSIGGLIPVLAPIPEPRGSAPSPTPSGPSATTPAFWCPATIRATRASTFGATGAGRSGWSATI